MGKARPAFGGCNGKLCHGGNGGDFWDSGLGSARGGLADSELRVRSDFFEGAVVVVAIGAADAALRQSPPLRARSRSGLVETRGNARVTFELQQPSGRRDLGSAALQRRCDGGITNWRSPANAGSYCIRRQSAAARASAEDSGVARGRDETSKLATAGVRREQRPVMQDLGEAVIRGTETAGATVAPDAMISELRDRRRTAG